MKRQELNLNRRLLDVLSKNHENTFFLIIETKHEDDVISDISKIFKKYNAQVLSGYFTIENNSKTFIYSLNPNKADFEIDQLVNELKSMKNILDVKTGSKKVSKLKSPPFWAELKVVGNNAYVIPEWFIKSCSKAIKDIFGEADKALIFHLGKGIGGSLVSFYMRVSKVQSFTEALQLIGELLKTIGVIDAYTLKITDDTYEASINFTFKGKTENELVTFKKYLIKGVIKGIIDNAGKIIEVIETEDNMEYFNQKLIYFKVNMRIRKYLNYKVN